MKRLIAMLLAGLLCAGLAACGTPDEPAPASGMCITPYALNEEEQALLKLADTDRANTALVLYDYQADERLCAITVARYVLTDALTWERDPDYGGAVYSEEGIPPQGRLALAEAPGGSFAFNLLDGGGGYSLYAPPLPEGLPDGCSSGAGGQSETVSIVYGEEIPLLVRTFRTDDTMPVMSTAVFTDAASRERMRDSVFTEAFTVTFADTVPET